MTTVRDDNRFAILITIIGSVCFVIQDSGMKWLTDDIAVLQIIFLRSAFALLFLVVAALLVGNRLTLRSDRPWLLLSRTVLNVFSWCCFFFGLKYLSLATATALFFSFPIYLAALSIPFLGEKVGRRRWSAMLVGFIGVLFMTNPGSDFHWSTLLMIVAAVSCAGVAILTKKLAQSRTAQSGSKGYHAITASSMLFHTLIGFCIATAIPQYWIWKPVSTDGMMLMAMAGFFGVIAQFILVKAYSIASPSVVAPFEYFGLIWAAIVGYFIWQDVPGFYTIFGALLIICSNLYILNRETKVTAVQTSE